MPEFKDKARFTDVTVKARTDKALLCVIDEVEVWIPQSQIDDDSEVYDVETEGCLVVSEWIAKQKGLI